MTCEVQFCISLYSDPQNKERTDEREAEDEVGAVAILVYTKLFDVNSYYTILEPCNVCKT